MLFTAILYHYVLEVRAISLIIHFKNTTGGFGVLAFYRRTKLIIYFIMILMFMEKQVFLFLELELSIKLDTLGKPQQIIVVIFELLRSCVSLLLEVGLSIINIFACKLLHSDY
jgi:hypothetical protein